jgi:hypothetical protein
MPWVVNPCSMQAFYGALTHSHHCHWFGQWYAATFVPIIGGLPGLTEPKQQAAFDCLQSQALPSHQWPTSDSMGFCRLDPAVAKQPLGTWSVKKGSSDSLTDVLSRHYVWF